MRPNSASGRRRGRGSRERLVRRGKKRRKTRRRSISGVSDPVTDYAKSVIAGRVIGSRWVKMASERHLKDLKRKDLRWDLDKCPDCARLNCQIEDFCPHSALDAINFFKDVLRLNGGQFEGKPFMLEPSQQFIVGSIFGWKFLDGTRRFKMAYVEEGKGNGKSPLAAGIGMRGLVADGEARAEIYAAATKKDQAMVLFRDAVAMRDQSPELEERLQKSGVGEKCWNLAYHETASFFRPISSDEDSQSGPRPHMALVDEVHEHKTSVVIVMLEKGFKFRRNPLLFMITNSGTSRETVCWYYHEYGTRILKGTAENDRMFVYIAALDACEAHWKEGQEQPVDNCRRCDDWRTEGDHWLKANPLLDVIVKRQTLRDAVRKALDIPSEENETRRLNFCYWTNQVTRWLSMEAWDSCSAPINYEELRGRDCIIGLDLANKIDIAAMVLLFPPRELALAAPTVQIVQDVQTVQNVEEEEINYSRIDIERLKDDFVVLPYFWIPKDTIQEAMRRDNMPYDVWVREGLIEATEGNVIDYQAIKQKIIALKDVYPIRSKWENGATFHLAGFDPWNATEFANDMKSRFGVQMIEVRQGYQSMSEPTKEMARLIKAKKFRHGGNAVLRWMADNMVVRTDPAGNIKPDKEKSKKKIDGIVALIMALALAIRNAGTGRSIYEERGVLRI